MGLADRRRRRSIHEDALANNAKSADDVNKEVPHNDDKALAGMSDEFFDSLVSAHPAPVVYVVPTCKHVTVHNNLPFFLDNFFIADDLVEMCLLN